MDCPVCGYSDNIVKNGYKLRKIEKDTVKRQRYKCKKCGSTFYSPDEYKKIKGKKDIRIKLLGIILKHSFFALPDLNEFFGYEKKFIPIVRLGKNNYPR